MSYWEVLDFKDIDFLSIGEGEKTIVELLIALEKNKELNSVNGIVFRENGKIISTKPQSYVENLDSLDFPLTSLSPDMIIKINIAETIVGSV